MQVCIFISLQIVTKWDWDWALLCCLLCFAIRPVLINVLQDQDLTLDSGLDYILTVTHCHRDTGTRTDQNKHRNNLSQRTQAQKVIITSHVFRISDGAGLLCHGSGSGHPGVAGENTQLPQSGGLAELRPPGLQTVEVRGGGPHLLVLEPRQAGQEQLPGDLQQSQVQTDQQMLAPLPPPHLSADHPAPPVGCWRWWRWQSRWRWWRWWRWQSRWRWWRWWRLW